MIISNWNNQPKIKNAKVFSFPQEPEATFCARGCGSSYGDVSLNDVILDMTNYKDRLALSEGVLDVSAGYTLREILNQIVPKGYMLPVMPGTSHVTVGGMIAADVHGKNHADKGSIGHWIDTICIQLPNGTQEICSLKENTDLFKATIGGLGLTGIIISARLKVEKIRGIKWQQNIKVYTSLGEFIQGLQKSSASYKTGWFEARSANKWFILENEPEYTEEEITHFQLSKPKIKVPRIPISMVSSPLMRIYNWNYARKLNKNRTRTIRLDECFFPLDAISHWNRLYGIRGFHQLQFVVPMDKSKNVIDDLLNDMRKAGHVPVLSVVKIHGDMPLPGILSFTTPGISVAFDFINKKGTDQFIKKLHGKIADAGGKVYLVKDAILSSSDFERMYPQADQFRMEIAKYNTGQISSLLSKRLKLVKV